MEDLPSNILKIGVGRSTSVVVTQNSNLRLIIFSVFFSRLYMMHVDNELL